MSQLWFYERECDWTRREGWRFGIRGQMLNDVITLGDGFVRVQLLDEAGEHLSPEQRLISSRRFGDLRLFDEKDAMLDSYVAWKAHVLTLHAHDEGAP